ncbi:hypothetical protein FOZ63_010469, partial [Perkinsus olseni]
MSASSLAAEGPAPQPPPTTIGDVGESFQAFRREVNAKLDSIHRKPVVWCPECLVATRLDVSILALCRHLIECLHVAATVDMLLKQQDLCYSSPASSASWPHCPIPHEGPREILL